MSGKAFAGIAAAVFLLAYCVVVLGAYVRLTHAGLGCPDWPGCYGRVVVPDAAQAAERYPDRPLDPGKAWREMTHRYAAETLGFGILALAFLAVRNRRDPLQPSRFRSFSCSSRRAQAWLGPHRDRSCSRSW